MTSTSASKPSSGSIQEYTVRVPKGSDKKHSIMKFNMRNIDPSTWTQVKMERENNAAEFKTELDDQPKFGAGSVYNNEQKQIARRKKYGIVSRNYNPDNQPWLLKYGGKAGKKFRGVREGGILDNASFYVFTEAPDGAFEAFPVEEWYNFTPVARYKTLNAEEAEEEFGRRDKVLNFFSIMSKKRLKNEEDEVEGEKTNEKASKSQNASDFKISEMDDWTDASEQEESESEEEKAKKKKVNKKKKVPVKKKTKKRGTDDEAEEDSDDIDEGQEVDYISNDSSSSDDELKKDRPQTKTEMKGVEDEEALRVFDLSDDEDEEEKKEDEKEENDDKQDDKNKEQKNKKGSSSESSSDSSDSDNIDSDIKSAMFIQKANKGKNGSDNSASSSRANTPTSQLASNPLDAKKNKRTKPSAAMKRRADEDGSTVASSQSKKHKHDPLAMEGLSEDSIRRYLIRKPITAAELFQKFKSKKCGMADDQLATTIAAILKRMNLKKQMIKGKIYWSLKE